MENKMGTIGITGIIYIYIWIIGRYLIQYVVKDDESQAASHAFRPMRGDTKHFPCQAAASHAKVEPSQADLQRSFEL